MKRGEEEAKVYNRLNKPIQKLEKGPTNQILSNGPKYDPLIALKPKNKGNKNKKVFKLFRDKP